jgi:adenylosuccinate synthase
VRDYSELVPEYIELPGWSEDITRITKWEDLPLSAKSYIREIERLVGCPIHLVSVGPGREATIELEPSQLLRGFLHAG